MNVLIIEDEERSAQKLKNYLEILDKDLIVLAILKSVRESISYLKGELEPDLIFLDVQLSDGISFDIFKKVTSSSFIVFVTAYDEYSLKAFELNTVSYLLKPFDQADVVKALKKFYHYVGGKSNKFDKDRLVVQKGNRSYTFSTTDVAYFIKDKVIFLVTRAGEKFLMSSSLDKLEQILSPSDFFRINRSCLVNYQSIESFTSHVSHRYLLKLHGFEGEEFIVSQGRAADFKKWIRAVE